MEGHFGTSAPSDPWVTKWPRALRSGEDLFESNERSGSSEDPHQGMGLYSPGCEVGCPRAYHSNDGATNQVIQKLLVTVTSAKHRGLTHFLTGDESWSWPVIDDKLEWLTTSFERLTRPRETINSPKAMTVLFWLSFGQEGLDDVRIDGITLTVCASQGAKVPASSANMITRLHGVSQTFRITNATSFIKPLDPPAGQHVMQERIGSSRVVIKATTFDHCRLPCSSAFTNKSLSAALNEYIMLPPNHSRISDAM
jgi:hypothetical protein